MATPPVSWRLAASIAFGSYVGYFLIRFIKFLIKPYFSPLRSIRGPDATVPMPIGSWIRLPPWVFGAMAQVMKRAPGEQHEEWMKEYGHVFVYKTFFGRDRLFFTDPKALNHVLTNSAWIKPPQVSWALSRVLGEGLVTSEGPSHKRQRRVMNPSFSTGHIRELTHIFLAKSLELRDTLLVNPDTQIPVDILNLLSRTTLDIIGLAGFNYTFDSLRNGEEGDELSQVFAKAVRPSGLFPFLTLLKGYFKPLRFITFDPQSKAQARARATMERIGKELIATRKRLLLEDGAADKGAKDLLSLLVDANVNVGKGGEKGLALSDDEVLYQIPTFLGAGHETTSNATAWAIYALCMNPDIQTKLRTELLPIRQRHPSMEELNALPYLDVVVKEALRLHAPVSNLMRVAREDDVIPVEKPYVDRYGVLRKEIPVTKGDSVFIPLLVMNRLDTIWGEDAKKFRPERWFNLPSDVNTIPSAWGNIMTFSYGPRACIGLKFAVTEMKALLFVLIRSFEFKLAFDPKDLVTKPMLVSRPSLKSDPKKGPQLPVFITPVMDPSL